MRFRSVIVLLLTLFLTVEVQGQLLWSISGNGLSKNSYLFGTHHLIDKDLIPHFDSILALCGRSDATIGEMDLRTPGMQKKMMDGAVMKGKKIKELVSDSDYQVLDSEFKSVMGLGMNVLGSLKPMMLMSMHQIFLYLKSTGTKKPPTAVDELFQKQAMKNKKDVIGLETLDFQMNVLFNSIPLERQAEILLFEVREKEQLVSDLKQLNGIYLKGDLDKMRVLDVDDKSMKPEEKELLVDDRNLNWVNQLPALLMSKSCFIAVGCMHLVGETGLINQLRLKGYTISPVLIN
ncbi:MAG TPA: TraB/GumN family protein [Bacteroidales bacterium]|nr:TraB/GumN family protein [Bacteroidales bacterium]